MNCAMLLTAGFGFASTCPTAAHRRYGNFERPAPCAILVGNRAMGHYAVVALFATVFDKILHHGRVGQSAGVA